MVTPCSLCFFCRLLSFFFFFFIIFIFIQPSYATTITTTTKTTELVNKVCHQTSNYRFCVEALYSDKRTPDADSYVLAYVSFGMTYLNATSTRDHIAELLKNASSGQGHLSLSKRLQQCHRNYEKAVAALEEAYNDLNSETFFQLGDLAGVAGDAADDCQADFKGITSPLTRMNHDLKGLSEICVSVSKLFNVSM